MAMDASRLNELDEESWISESNSLGDNWRSKVAADYAYAVVYCLGEVEILDFKRPSSWKEPEDLLEIRAFNEDGELHAVKTENGEFAGRIRIDKKASDPKEATSVFDELHVLWGARADEQDGGSFVLVEDRGTKVSVPVSVLPNDGLTEGSRVALRVRNYLNPKDCSFTDYRFVGFEIIKEG